MNRRRIVGIGLGALAGAAYGTGPYFFKAWVLPAHVGWIPMLVWRFVFATAVSWLWLAAQPTARAALGDLDRRTIARLLFTGAFFIVNASVYYAAIAKPDIDTSLVALIMSIYPALVAVLSMRLGYKFQGKLAWASLAIVLAGTALTVGNIKAGTSQDGVILALLSPVAYALYIVITAWMAGERPGQTADMRSKGRGAEVSPPVAGAVMMTGTLIATVAMGVATSSPILPGDIPQAAWPGLVGIGIFAAAVAIQAFYASAARIGAAQASLMATVEPIVVIFLGITLLGDSVTPIKAVGAVIVISGVLLAQFATPAESRPVILEEL